MFLNKKNDTGKKNQLVNLINSGLKDLKEETKKMSETEIKNEEPESIVNVFKRFLSSIDKINKKDKV